MRNSNINLKRTPERVELVKSMVDPNRQIALAAQQAFAEYIRPAVQQVLLAKATSNSVYRDLEFSKNDRPTIPLDTFLGTKENNVRIWSQSVAGGLPTNLIQGLGEYTFSTYRLDSAVSFYEQYIRNANLPVLTAGIDRMINEILVKQEKNAWYPLLSALAANSQIYSSKVPGVFQLEDLNTLFTKIDRIYTSYVGGTPEGVTPQGLTDLFVSPEVVGQIRAFAYNPMNVRGGYKADGSEQGGVVPLPDSVREQIYRGGGLVSIYDVSIHKLIELGKGQKYNTVFDNFYAGSNPPFTGATQEIVIGFDLSRDVFLRPVITDDDYSNGQVVVLPDDQFQVRSEKVGFFSRVIEGRAILDSRPIVGLVV